MPQIGLLGGAFNPFHLGHLQCAKVVYEKLALDKIYFLPAGNPYYKENILPFSIRKKMIEISIAQFPFMEVKDWDNTKEKSYTAILMKKLQKLFPEDKFYFIIGEDNVQTLQNWYDFAWLIKNVEFVVINRNSKQNNYKNLAYLNKLNFIKMEPLDISSTEIRKNLIAKPEIEKYLPKEIVPLVKNYYFKEKK